MAVACVLKSVAAITTIIALILIAIAFLRCIIFSSWGKHGGRIEVKEYQKIGGTRHLALVRHDDREYFLVTGGPQDLVIETNAYKYDDDCQDILDVPALALKHALFEQVADLR